MKKIFFLSIIYTISLNSISQNDISQISGNFENNLQTYNEDPSIGAEKVDEFILNNAFLNILYTKGNFSTGIRYESYLNALQDYDSKYTGNGIPYRFGRYISGDLDITVGNYYEQFGSGLIFRTYEDKGLGVDNAMDGIRLKYSPIPSVSLKAFIGKSRTYFDYSEGIIRGADAEININEVFKINSGTIYTLGGGIVSRYQKDNNPMFNLPQNVAAMSTRVNIMHKGINYYGEYAYKINDPIGSYSMNVNNYASGKAIVNNISYSQKGLGISLESHWIDHMEFRSERALNKEFIINYIPTLSKQHSYKLLGLYPGSTQAEGEAGIQADIYYKFNKGTLIGGKYGTKINLNLSQINGIKNGTSFLDDSTNISANIFSFDNEKVYFSDINIEVNKKINKKIKSNIVISKQQYNKDVLEGKSIGQYGIINSTIGVIDVNYKIKKGHTVRIELQELLAKDDPDADSLSEGSWHMGLIEYTISPNWFFTIQDMYNWGNHDKDKQLHYFNISGGFVKGGNRFEIGYGKKREGIFCVGGVCKVVPSSNGLTVNISSSF